MWVFLVGISCLRLQVRFEHVGISCLQVRFEPQSINHKTMKGLDRAAKQVMLPDYEIFSVNLTESKSICYDVVVLNAVLILYLIFYRA